jgi:GNAT superfamily N-acetyltransferase
VSTELIFCAASSAQFSKIAVEQGFSYGAQLPGIPNYPPVFVDQDWKRPNRAAYMAALRQYQPRLATCVDWETDDQLDEVLSWADEAARYVSEAVIIIPKVMGGIPRLPRTIRGKQVRLGYSVPTSFGGTCLPVWEFTGWPIHLLGGSPNNQLMLRDYMNVVSADGNYIKKMAQEFGQFFACNKQAVRSRTPQWPKLNEYHDTSTLQDVPYLTFRLSCANVQAAWRGCRAYIRYANESDLDAIKRIANQYKNELGFVNKAALRDSIGRYTLFVAEYMGAVAGFVNSYHRRDGWSTIYEIAVDKAHKGEGIGRALLDAVPRPVRLKCPVDNAANGFYAAQGMTLARVEQGRKRMLNVWERAIKPYSSDKQLLEAA